MDKRKKLLTGIFAGVLLLSVITVTYAYFVVSNNTSGNTGIVDVTTTQIANLTLTSSKSEVGSPLYPGWVGYQTISVAATNEGSAIYSLSLNVTSESASATDLLEDVQYAICRATSSQNVSYTAATPTNDGNQFYMSGGSVSLPAGCVETIVSDVSSPYTTGTMLETTGYKTIKSSKTIESGTTDYYYVIYRYLNLENQDDAQGASFTATPNAGIEYSII